MYSTVCLILAGFIIPDFKWRVLIHLQLIFVGVIMWSILIHLYMNIVFLTRLFEESVFSPLFFSSLFKYQMIVVTSTFVYVFYFIQLVHLSIFLFYFFSIILFFLLQLYILKSGKAVYPIFLLLRIALTIWSLF